MFFLRRAKDSSVMISRTENDMLALVSKFAVLISLAFCLSWKITNTAPKITAMELIALRSETRKLRSTIVFCEERLTVNIDCINVQIQKLHRRMDLYAAMD